MNSSPVALAFDLDGTITDSIEACIVAVQRAYELAELEPPSREQLVPTVGLPLATSLPPLLRSESLPVDEYLPVLMENYTAAYPEVSRLHTSLFPGIAQLVRRLSQDHALGIVTSKYTETATDVLDHLGLSDCFLAVVGSDLTDALKPDPAPLFALCQFLGVSPADVVMFGDADVDMKMAGAAGAVGIGVTWGTASAEQLWEAGASEVISAPDSLLRALARVIERRSG